MGVLNWNGGKVRVAQWVVDNLPAHRVYIEPFFGGGAVYFKKPASSQEVINDINGDVVNFFRVVRDKELCERLIEQLQYTPFARDEYLGCMDITSEDAVERARKLFVAVNTSFRGIYLGRGNYYVSENNRIATFRRRAELFGAISERMQFTEIENRDALELMVRRDKEDVCYYCDPPYVPASRLSSRAVYKYEMEPDWHERFVDVLLGLKGKAVVSGYPNGTYERLEQSNWVRLDKKVTRASKDNRNGYVIESLWFSPSCSITQGTPNLDLSDRSPILRRSELICQEQTP